MIFLTGVRQYVYIHVKKSEPAILHSESIFFVLVQLTFRGPNGDMITLKWSKYIHIHSINMST